MKIRALHSSQDLTVAEFNHDFEFAYACRLLTVYVHATAPIREEITVTYVSDEGVLYNTLVEARILQDEQDYIFAAVGTIAINEAEMVNVNVTNANTTGAVYVTVKVDA